MQWFFPDLWFNLQLSCTLISRKTLYRIGTMELKLYRCSDGTYGGDKYKKSKINKSTGQSTGQEWVMWNLCKPKEEGSKPNQKKQASNPKEASKQTKRSKQANQRKQTNEKKVSEQTNKKKCPQEYVLGQPHNVWGHQQASYDTFQDWG